MEKFQVWAYGMQGSDDMLDGEFDQGTPRDLHEILLWDSLRTSTSWDHCDDRKRRVISVDRS